MNALGAVVDRQGQLVRCHRNKNSGDCEPVAQLINDTDLIKDMRGAQGEGPTNNTTLTLVVTNQKLPYWALQRLATQVHTSMGRAIQPFSTQYDGDVLYAVTTAEVEDPDMDPMSLTMAASELAWDAVLNSVPELPKLPEPLTNAPDIRMMENLQGQYHFYGNRSLSVEIVGDQLKANYSGKDCIYFTEGRTYDLIPAADNLFIVDTPARDVIKFKSDIAGNIEGLTINPGLWHVEAIKE